MAIASKGSCNLCGKVLSKSGMTRHLSMCGDSMPSRSAGSLHLVVESPWAKEYWLHLAAPVGKPLQDVDRFLRFHWLECCGHLSLFRTQGDTYYSSKFEPGDKTMRVKLGSVAGPGSRLAYEYDIGSTTPLTIHVAGLRGSTPDGRVQLLARNDDPGTLCSACRKNKASTICVECENGDRKGWLCHTCAAEHDCDEDMRLPVLNSPRAGVCGYTGTPFG